MIGEKIVTRSREYDENIINTVREPLIVLDQDLRVVLVSRSFYEFFQVKPEETVGQLIYDLGNKQWDIPKLRELLETILPEKTSFDNYEVEHDFATIGRRTMLLNARQIERAWGKERIILLAIEDITERKEIEAGLETTRKELAVIKISADAAHEFAESVINTVREPLISLDQDLRVVTVSRSFYEFFKVKPEETVGQLIYDLGNKQWDIPQLRELLETILPEKTSFDNYEVEHDFTTIGRRTMLLNARQIKQAWGKERIILLAIEDITEHKRLENLLKESEYRYRRVFETASDGIVLLEKNEGHIVHANPALEKMLGFSEAEYIGKKLPDIGVPLDMSDFSTIMQDLARRGILNYQDVPVRTKFGQDVPADIYMVDRAGLAQCNIRDVSERKKVEERLNEAKNKAQEYLDVAGVMIVALDSGGMIKLINKKGLDILGYEGHEVIGQNWFELCVPGGIREDVQMAFRKLMAGDVEQVEYFENPIVTKGGEERIMAFHNALLRNVSGEISGVLSSGEDITERKKTEDALRESEKRFRQIAESTEEWIWEVDKDGLYTYVNNIAENIIGYKPEELVGKKYFYDLFPADKREQQEKETFEFMAAKKVVLRYANVNVHKDGSIILIETNGVPILDSRGDLKGYRGVDSNITAYRKLEDQLFHAQKMEAIGTLAGGVAHDFNNILNVIMGYGVMVMDTLAAGSPAKEDMEEVLAAADRAADLTKRLLVFSRKQVVEVTLVNINELIFGLRKMLARIIREDIDFHVDLMDRPLIVLADAGQIEQVLINLAANARDAMPNGGRLTISTGLEELDEEYVAAYGYGKPGRYALITVADTGQGMDAETQKKIFEPFFTTKGIGEGTGLGLAISYGIIKQHDGYIKVYSEPGHGTVFKIYLPLSEAVALPDKKTEDVVAVKGGNETILVAEDDATLRKLTEIILESFGYTVIAAEDGEDAITKFMENRERIRLVVLDMIMPKKNGKEVSAAIRKVSPRMGIVFVSGYTMDIITNEELTEGGLDFIQKPFQSRDLLAKVREVLDR
jgi:PAS domain S-box-containing protein